MADIAQDRRPAQVCAALLAALEASEGRRRSRKRDQTPDAIGLAIKRGLYERAVLDDPEPDVFESWLVAQALAAPAAGPVRALAAQILEEYQLAALDPSFSRWLQEGAPSADSDES